MPLVFVEYGGDVSPLEIPGDIRVGEFKQMLQMAFSIPVENQRIDGMRNGITDSSDVEAAVDDGDTLRLQWRDAAAEARDAAAEHAEMERLQRELEQQHGADAFAGMLGHHDFSAPAPAAQPAGTRDTLIDPHSEDAELQAAMQMSMGGSPHDFAGGNGGGGGFLNSLGLGGLGGGWGAPQASAPTIPSALRALSTAAPTSRLSRGDTISTEIDVDDLDAGHDAKRAKVDSELGESLSSIVCNELSVCPSFSHVLSDVRRERKPLCIIIYNVAHYESVCFLSSLSHALEDSETKAICAQFATFMAEVKSQAYDEFVRIIENNQDLQNQMSTHCPPQMLDAPVVCIVVPQPNSAALKIERLIHSSVTRDAFLGAMLHALADHSERLETEREVGQALDETRMLKAEQEGALMEAMIRDRELEEQRKEEARKQAEEEERARATALSEAEEARRQQEAAERAEREKTQALQARREERKGKLPPPPEGTAGVVRVMLRLPNGERVERKFNVEDNLETAYWFMDLSPEITAQFPNPDACRLVSSFPKQTFSLSDDGQKTFKSLQLTGGVALFLEG